MKYRVIKNLGLGLGLGSDSLKLLEATDKSRFDYSNPVTGMHFFISGNF